VLAMSRRTEPEGALVILEPINLALRFLLEPAVLMVAWDQ
jgi:hypothetical protein